MQKPRLKLRKRFGFGLLRLGWKDFRAFTDLFDHEYEQLAGRGEFPALLDGPLTPAFRDRGDRQREGQKLLQHGVGVQTQRQR